MSLSAPTASSPSADSMLPFMESMEAAIDCSLEAMDLRRDYCESCPPQLYVGIFHSQVDGVEAILIADNGKSLPRDTMSQWFHGRPVTNPVHVEDDCCFDYLAFCAPLFGKYGNLPSELLSLGKRITVISSMSSSYVFSVSFTGSKAFPQLVSMSDVPSAQASEFIAAIQPSNSVMKLVVESFFNDASCNIMIIADVHADVRSVISANVSDVLETVTRRWATMYHFYIHGLPLDLKLSWKELAHSLPPPGRKVSHPRCIYPCHISVSAFLDDRCLALTKLRDVVVFPVSWSCVDHYDSIPTALSSLALNVDGVYISLLRYLPSDGSHRAVALTEQPAFHFIYRGKWLLSSPAFPLSSAYVIDKSMLERVSGVVFIRSAAALTSIFSKLQSASVASCWFRKRGPLSKWTEVHDTVSCKRSSSSRSVRTFLRTAFSAWQRQAVTLDNVFDVSNCTMRDIVSRLVLPENGDFVYEPIFESSFRTLTCCTSGKVYDAGDVLIVRLPDALVTDSDPTYSDRIIVVQIVEFRVRRMDGSRSSSTAFVDVIVQFLPADVRPFVVRFSIGDILRGLRFSFRASEQGLPLSFTDIEACVDRILITEFDLPPETSYLSDILAKLPSEATLCRLLCDGDSEPTFQDLCTMPISMTTLSSQVFHLFLDRSVTLFVHVADRYGRRLEGFLSGLHAPSGSTVLFRGSRYVVLSPFSGTRIEKRGPDLVWRDESTFFSTGHQPLSVSWILMVPRESEESITTSGVLMTMTESRSTLGNRWVTSDIQQTRAAGFTVDIQAESRVTVSTELWCESRTQLLARFSVSFALRQKRPSKMRCMGDHGSSRMHCSIGVPFSLHVCFVDDLGSLAVVSDVQLMENLRFMMLDEQGGKSNMDLHFTVAEALPDGSCLLSLVIVPLFKQCHIPSTLTVVATLWDMDLGFALHLSVGHGPVWSLSFPSTSSLTVVSGQSLPTVDLLGHDVFGYQVPVQFDLIYMSTSSNVILTDLTGKTMVQPISCPLLLSGHVSHIMLDRVCVRRSLHEHTVGSSSATLRFAHPRIPGRTFDLSVEIVPDPSPAFLRFRSADGTVRDLAPGTSILEFVELRAGEKVSEALSLDQLELIDECGQPSNINCVAMARLIRFDGSEFPICSPVIPSCACVDVGFVAPLTVGLWRLITVEIVDCCSRSLLWVLSCPVVSGPPTRLTLFWQETSQMVIRLRAGSNIPVFSIVLLDRHDNLVERMSSADLTNLQSKYASLELQFRIRRTDDSSSLLLPLPQLRAHPLTRSGSYELNCIGQTDGQLQLLSFLRLIVEPGVIRNLRCVPSTLSCSSFCELPPIEVSFVDMHDNDTIVDPVTGLQLQQNTRVRLWWDGRSCDLVRKARCQITAQGKMMITHVIVDIPTPVFAVSSGHLVIECNVSATTLIIFELPISVTASSKILRFDLLPAHGSFLFCEENRWVLRACDIPATLLVEASTEDGSTFSLEDASDVDGGRVRPSASVRVNEVPLFRFVRYIPGTRQLLFSLLPEYHSSFQLAASLMVLRVQHVETRRQFPSYGRHTINTFRLSIRPPRQVVTTRPLFAGFFDRYGLYRANTSWIVSKMVEQFQAVMLLMHRSREYQSRHGRICDPCFDEACTVLHQEVSLLSATDRTQVNRKPLDLVFEVRKSIAGRVCQPLRKACINLLSMRSLPSPDVSLPDALSKFPLFSDMIFGKEPVRNFVPVQMSVTTIDALSWVLAEYLAQILVPATVYSKMNPSDQLSVMRRAPALCVAAVTNKLSKKYYECVYAFLDEFSDLFRCDVVLAMDSCVWVVEPILFEEIVHVVLEDVFFVYGDCETGLTFVEMFNETSIPCEHLTVICLADGFAINGMSGEIQTIEPRRHGGDRIRHAYHYFICELEHCLAVFDALLADLRDVENRFEADENLKRTAEAKMERAVLKLEANPGQPSKR